ncbi:unnamed protein product [Linum trigynum]|uniref:Uncharacterized protein n=1 Tax=Linum trigynum TaxID=586398 RepID=A0AAV2GWC9_9ROSI
MKTPRCSNRRRTHHLNILPRIRLPQSSETLTMNDDPDSQDSDTNQEDLTSSALMISFSPTSASSTRRLVGGGGGGLKGKKSKRLIASRLKNILKRLGLWDFVKLRFDANIRFDLVAQLIASYDPQQRDSYVNEARVKVSRPDLARALKFRSRRTRFRRRRLPPGRRKRAKKRLRSSTNWSRLGCCCTTTIRG